MNRVAATAAAVCTLVGAPAMAQAPPQPAVSVVVFDAGRAARIAMDQRAAAAEELAFLLVESGQYRVLDRAWLPAVDGPASLELLREAASAAGVTYLVTGRLNRRINRVPAPRSSGPIGPHGPIGGAVPGARGFGPVYAPGVLSARQYIAPREQTLTGLDVRVIDTRTGRIVLTFSHHHTGIATSSGDDGLLAVVQQAAQALLDSAAQLSPKTPKEVR